MGSGGTGAGGGGGLSQPGGTGVGLRQGNQFGPSPNAGFVGGSYGGNSGTYGDAYRTNTGYVAAQPGYQPQTAARDASGGIHYGNYGGYYPGVGYISPQQAYDMEQAQKTSAPAPAPTPTASRTTSSPTTATSDRYGTTYPRTSTYTTTRR